MNSRRSLLTRIPQLKKSQINLTNMKTTKLHTFKEVLNTGITVDGHEEPINISCLFIPKIQRSYAQGRKAESDIRTDFLDDIFSVLTSDKNTPLELSFLFGSKQLLINGITDGFELLDGQQRTTTLFLLYWYVYNREGKQMPDFLGRFTYETRDTSTNFLTNIAKKKFSFDEKKPSEVLKANKWFTDDYNCDPTVCAMLNMLDEIHSRYNRIEKPNLTDNLERLQFYVLLLEKFDMNDELYIKMNSRGLSLIPFENFKASIVRYMKKYPNAIYGGDKPEDGEIPYWLDFISKIDARWIDIFWQNPTTNDSCKINEEILINDNEIGNRYFRFLNRYFFTKAAILKGVDDKKLHALPFFFTHDCEDPEAEKRLRGWNNYVELFNLITDSQKDINLPSTRYPVFSAIERILETFLTHQDFILNCIHADPYGNTSNFDVLRKDKYLLPDKIIFAATTEFIENLPEEKDFNSEEVKANFKRMIRVAHNIIENTTIESDIPAVGVINALSEIIHYKGAIVDNFYYSLATNDLKSRNEQLKDEKEKAKEMFDDNGNYDQTWEDAFKKAEKHPFFKGSVSFFFTPKAGSSQDFSDRYSVIGNLFDENGITEDYRKNKQHILIRAMLSCLNHWDRSGLQDRFFTEKADNNDKYLKALVTGCPEVRIMFCNYFSDTSINIDDYLRNIVRDASCRPDETNASFKMLYRRLINDDNSSSIFDDVADRESSRGCFRIQNNRSYVIMIPSKWYDQLVLDTERHIIIPSLINDYSFDYNDDNQSKQIDSPLHDYWGWGVDIHKKLKYNNKEYSLHLNFNAYKQVEFYVYGSNVTDLELCFGITNNTVKDGICLPEKVPYQLDNNKQVIIDKITEIENKLAAIP